MPLGMSTLLIEQETKPRQATTDRRRIVFLNMMNRLGEITEKAKKKATVLSLKSNGGGSMI